MALSPFVDNFGPQNRQGWGDAAPSLSTDGTWQVGDRIWNTAPSGGGPDYWVCTASGTPGTWKSGANLAA